MELLCPHCMKRVTVSDDKAGQVLNCPLCNGVFAAPSLPGAEGDDRGRWAHKAALPVAV